MVSTQKRMTFLVCFSVSGCRSLIISCELTETMRVFRTRQIHLLTSQMFQILWFWKINIFGDVFKTLKFQQLTTKCPNFWRFCSVLRSSHLGHLRCKWWDFFCPLHFIWILTGYLFEKLTPWSGSFWKPWGFAVLNINAHRLGWLLGASLSQKENIDTKVSSNCRSLRLWPNSTDISQNHQIWIIWKVNCWIFSCLKKHDNTTSLRISWFLRPNLNSNVK